MEKEDEEDVLRPEYILMDEQDEHILMDEEDVLRRNIPIYSLCLSLSPVLLTQNCVCRTAKEGAGSQCRKHEQEEEESAEEAVLRSR